jgi:iron complex outermembrane receptor protein
MTHSGFAACRPALRTDAVKRSAGDSFLLRGGLLFATLAITAAPASALTQLAQNFVELSLEELANIEVTSVSKKTQSLATAPASIFVITGEEIRRSGATTLPEALRLAPNLQVARLDARNYAVTARGFNSAFENKLLVLIDGRTVYSPLFSGVFWDAQDVMLEDIERVEIISGPGATLWGANAVNGVINIMTRSAADTQGGLLAAGSGRHEKNGSVRYGGKLENGGYYRVYGKYADNDNSRRADGSVAADGWHRSQTGFRADWQGGNGGLTVQGDAYTGKLRQLGTRDIRIAGANLLGRATRSLGDDSEVRVQAYLDHTQRDQPNAFVEHLDTLDLELQHAVKLGAIHNVVWGGGYRHAWDRLRNDRSFAFLPAKADLHWGNVFAKDEIELRKNLRLTLGLKMEHNHYTGMESLPSIRLAWNAAKDHMIWASASRAVRVPSRIDRDFFAPPAPLMVNGVPRFIIAGGPDFVSETAKVAEIGYRAQPTAALSYSLTAFYSQYDRLRTLEPGPAGAVFRNLAEGNTRGIELTGTWQAAQKWRLSGGLVAQRFRLRPKPGSMDSAAGSSLSNNDPGTYMMLRSSYDISSDKELDITVRRVGRLPRPEVPAYTSMDLRFGWRVNRDLELSLLGQNLLNESHAEFGAAPGRSEFERSLFLKFVWRL